MNTKNEITFGMQKDQSPHGGDDGKEATRELLRERRDELLDDDPFIPPQTTHRRLAAANEEQDAPLEASEVSAIVKERPSKRGLVTRENTREYLIRKGGKHHNEDESRGELLKRLRLINSENCEVELPTEALEEVATAIMSGTTSGETRTNSFARIQLDDGLRGGLPDPEEFEADVLLKGDAHQIFTGPGEGKSWLALWLTANGIRRGQTVMYFDMENGPRVVTERLQALGIGSADDHLQYHYVPPVGMNQEVRADYVALLDEIKPELLVFDSWVGFLAACGLDENSPTNVEEWANAYVHPAKAQGCTVVILDHVPHNADRSRGATRKKDLVDVQWHLKKEKDFDRGTVGYIQLIKKKDREAWLPERVGFSIGGADDGFVFQRSEGNAACQLGQGLPESAREALRALETFGNQGATYSAWKNVTTFKGKAMVDSTFRTAREKLMHPDHKLVRHEDDRYYSNDSNSTATAVSAVGQTLQHSTATPPVKGVAAVVDDVREKKEVVEGEAHATECDCYWCGHPEGDIARLSPREDEVEEYAEPRAAS